TDRGVANVDSRNIVKSGLHRPNDLPEHFFPLVGGSLREFEDIVERVDALFSKGSGSCSSELSHVGAYFENFPDIVDKFPDVSSRLTSDTEENLSSINFHIIYRVDCSFPHFPLDRSPHRRLLKYVTDKILQYTAESGLIDFAVHRH